MESPLQYIAVKASLHANYTQVFGLKKEEMTALVKRCAFHEEILNGIGVKSSVFTVINCLNEIGYRVICSSGDSEVTWTLAREMSNHHHTCDHNSGVGQTLEEMDFERGLWYAAQYNDEPRVRHLLEKGTSVNIEDKSGYTALHYAARNGHVDVCRLLLSSGANINAATRAGQATPLHRAVSAGQQSVIDLLLTKGADAYLQDIDGKSILHRASEEKHVEMFGNLAEKFPKLLTTPDYMGRLPDLYRN